MAPEILNCNYNEKCDWSCRVKGEVYFKPLIEKSLKDIYEVPH
jgi:hypothetical protein